MTEHLEELAVFAESLGDVSREILTPLIGRMPEYEIKADGSPVTPIDRQIEMALRERIADRYPSHGVLGEEFADQALDAEFVWVIDPIDGTKQFITGVPVYSTLIGLARDGKFIHGVMEFPATQDRWSGGPDHGALHNRRQVSARKCPKLAQALIAAGMPTDDRPEERDAVARLTEAGLWTVWGAGSYAFGLVANGRIDAAVYRGVDPFDYAAAVPIIEAAGGCCCDWSGARLTLHSGSQALLLGDPTVLAEAVACLARAAFTKMESL